MIFCYAATGFDGNIVIIETNARRDQPAPRNSQSKEEKDNPIVNIHGCDLLDIRGQPVLKRGLEIAAAGGHHLLLFGPPGCGKTMAAERFSTLLPNLSREESLEVTRIHSQVGMLPEGTGLVTRPPYRSPHHSASGEGVIGGGMQLRQREIALAHRGILFLDEAPDFKPAILQNIREQIEQGRINLSKASGACWYPARFQLILAANPCPCGNLGKDDAVCICSRSEIIRYWKRLGGPVIDRIDIRIPLESVKSEVFISRGGESSTEIRIRVQRARKIQKRRFKGILQKNVEIPPGEIEKYCALTPCTKKRLIEALSELPLSNRAGHSILKIARTIADLDEKEMIEEEHLLEAVQHRRYGDGDFFWMRAG